LTGQEALGKYETAFLDLKQAEIPMDLAVADDLSLLTDGVRAFVEAELLPHEDLVEKLDAVPDELFRQIQQKALAAGFYALNMPEEHGGGGLGARERSVCEIEFGRVSRALGVICAGWE
jgi:acyl-CoA dehydrogenase